MIDKTKVKKFFSRHAHEYDKHSSLQQRMGDKLLAKINSNLKNPKRILDIGSGTGFISKKLHNKFPNSEIICCDIAHGMSVEAKFKLGNLNNITFVTADAEILPFGDETFDLVISNATFQWMNELSFVFKEIMGVLMPGGSFYFSTFGTNTLFELRNSFVRASEELNPTVVPHIQRFKSLGFILGIMDDKQFHRFGVDLDVEKEHYADVRTLIKTLQSIGAQNASMNAPKGLRRRDVINRMIEIYNTEYKSGIGIVATYEIVNGFAQK